MIGLYTIEGRKVWEIETTDEEIKFNAGSLQSGIYLLRVQDDGKMYTDKLIVK